MDPAVSCRSANYLYSYAVRLFDVVFKRRQCRFDRVCIAIRRAMVYLAAIDISDEAVLFVID